MYTEGTQNFNLPLYQGTDKPAWTDTNEGYAAIDEAVGSAVATVEGLDTRVATVEGEISDPTTGIDAQLAAVKEDVTTLQGDVGTLSGTVSGLQSEIDDVRADCEDMITSNHESTATSSKRYEVGQYFIYNDVLYKCTVQINQGDTIVPNTNCEATNVMTEMPSGGGGGAAADVSLAPITGMTATNVQAGLAEHQSDIDQINSDLSDFSFRVNNGVPQFSTDGGTTWNNFGGGGMILDLNNKVEVGTSEITAASDGALIGNATATGVNSFLVVNSYNLMNYGNNGITICIHGIPTGTTMKLTAQSTDSKLYFVPYVTA